MYDHYAGSQEMRYQVAKNIAASASQQKYEQTSQRLEAAYGAPDGHWQSPPPASGALAYPNTAQPHGGHPYWPGAGNDPRLMAENDQMDTSKIDYLKDDLEYNIKSAVRTAKKSIHDV